MFEKEIEKLREAARALNEIAGRLGRIDKTISGRAVEKKRKKRRVTEEVKAKILELRKQGVAAPEIAKRLGVSQSTIYKLSEKGE